MAIKCRKCGSEWDMRIYDRSCPNCDDIYHEENTTKIDKDLTGDGRPSVSDSTITKQGET